MLWELSFVLFCFCVCCSRITRDKIVAVLACVFKQLWASGFFLFSFVFVFRLAIKESFMIPTKQGNGESLKGKGERKGGKISPSSFSGFCNISS